MLSSVQRACFAEPPWDEPLDAASELRAVPYDATIAGIFMGIMSSEAAKRGRPLPSARPRYQRFHYYPLREHVQLLTEYIEVLFGPAVTVRSALRRLGHGAPKVMLSSTVGRVTMGVADSAWEVLRALGQLSSSFLRPGNCTVELVEERTALVQLRDVHFFLDCHHVGIFEGAMHLVGVQGQVQVDNIGKGRADFLCTW